MKRETKVIAIKVGKKEHLESLKEGHVFFARNELFLNDETDFRGDPNEGYIFTDPTKIDIIVDGKSLFKDLNVPYPVEVKESFEGVEDIHIFCCSVLKSNVWTGKNNKKLTQEFINEMLKFGDHFLIFALDELIENIKSARGNEIGMISSYVKYKDIKNDFSPVKFPNESFYNRFFIKDKEKYEKQNEYRIIIDGAYEELKSNCENGYVLDVKPLETAALYNIDLLNSIELITEE